MEQNENKESEGDWYMIMDQEENKEREGNWYR